MSAEPLRGSAFENDEPEGDSRDFVHPSQSRNGPNPSPKSVDEDSNPAPTDSPSNVSGQNRQKRRRVTRACDECRRKKIKCDGKNPCTHCSVYSYECTYDQPSNRRRNPDPRYVEALEAQLRRAKQLLSNVYPEQDASDVMSMAETPSKEHAPAAGIKRSRTTSKESVIESMVENTGALMIDGEGRSDFYGPSSGRAFLGRIRNHFSELVGMSENSTYAMPRATNDAYPTNLVSASQDSNSLRDSGIEGLPSRTCARLLCENALDDACAVLRFVHRPSFYAMFDRIYDLQPDNLEGRDRRFLPLLFAVLAVGALFATAEQSGLMTYGFENAIDQGSKWFSKAKFMVDVTDIRDLTTLQTVLFMIMFLQSSAKLSDCYAYIGIALSSALRMGLHRSIDSNFDCIERETRKRIFWCIRKLDIYVGALLGLPRLLQDEDVDQDPPLEVDDELITCAEIHPMPSNKVSLMAGFNAHCRLVDLLFKVVRYVYPVKPVKDNKTQTYLVDHQKIRELEQDLQRWMEELPEPFKPNDQIPREYERIQHILRMSYAHIEMFLYRPFLHYASQDCLIRGTSKRAYACGAACVSVSRNIVHLTVQMKQRGLLIGSYWFYMYTTFFAINALVFYVLEYPTNPAGADILKDALEGKDTLARLASKSLAADRCTKYLTILFDQLSEKLDKVGTQPTKKSAHKKRQAVEPHPNGQAPQTSSASPKLQDSTSSAQPDDINVGATHQDRQSRHPCYQPLSTPTAAYAGLPEQEAKDTNATPMFSIDDPLAYPIQPLTTLESGQEINSPFYPPLGGGLDGNVYGPGLTNYYPQSSAAFETPQGWEWSQGQNPGYVGSRFSGDQLYGEDWGAAMYYGGQ